jgi:repressor LexA
MFLTPKQVKVLDFIAAYRRQRRYSPTLEEIAHHLGISKVTALQHVRALEQKGAITRARYRSRSMELLAPPAAPAAPAAAGPGAFPEVRFPLLGYISAGRPIEAIESNESFDLCEALRRERDCFILQVRGDSMIEDHIQDGDFVIVERRRTAEDGEMVVALLDTGEATLKRLYRDRGRFRLQPSNPALPPIFVTNLRVQGVVVGVLRKY